MIPTPDQSSDDPLHDQIERNLTNHLPGDDGVVRRFETLREAAKHYGHAIVEECPPSRERSLAVTALEESVMRAVQSIAVHQDQL